MRVCKKCKRKNASRRHYCFGCGEQLHRAAASGVEDCTLSTGSKPEKINTRLFDLCRYMRSELLEADLITEKEYWFLVHDCPLAQGAGSPSPRRLEDYDTIRARLNELENSQADWVAKRLNPRIVMLRQLISDQRKARQFAGKTVSVLIRLGASPEIMRRNNVPLYTFYGVFGGRKWEKTNPEKHAEELIDCLKASVLFEHNTQANDHE